MITPSTVVGSKTETKHLISQHFNKLANRENKNYQYYPLMTSCATPVPLFLKTF